MYMLCSPSLSIYLSIYLSLSIHIYIYIYIYNMSLRGNQLSNTSCLTHVFFNSDELYSILE